MTKTIFLTLTTGLLLNTVSLHATTKNVVVKTPGTLAQLISADERYVVTNLSIEGELNATDLLVLRDMAGSGRNLNKTGGQLKHVDMRKVVFVPGKQTYIDGNKNISITSRHDLPDLMFYGCEVESVLLPDSTTAIGEEAFAMSKLRTITLTEGVEIETGAFRGCKQLTEVTFPRFTKSIMQQCFEGCDRLTKFEINDIGNIACRAFRNIDNLQQIIIRGTLGHADGWMCSELASLRSLRFEGFVMSTGGPDIAEKCPKLSEIVFAGTCMPMHFGKVTDCPLVRKCTVTGYVMQSANKRFISYDKPTAGDKRLIEACRTFDRLARQPEYADVFGLEFTMHKTAAILSVIGEKQMALDMITKAALGGFDDYQDLQTNRDFDNIRHDERFKKAIEEIRKKNDYIYILQQSNPYTKTGPTDTLRFTYAQADEPQMARIRQHFNLDSIAGDGNEISRIKNIMNWLHNQIRHNGGSGFPKGAKRNAIDLIDACKAQKRGMNCRGLAIVLSELYMAMGWPSRFLTCESMDYENDPDCHVITIVWSHTLGKWVWMDPTMDAYVTDENGLLLHPGEVRQRLIDAKPLVLNADANWNHEASQTKEHYLESYMAKNLYLISAYLHSDSNVDNGKNCFTLQPDGFEAQVGTATSNEQWFWQAPE